MIYDKFRYITYKIVLCICIGVQITMPRFRAITFFFPSKFKDKSTSSVDLFIIIVKRMRLLFNNMFLAYEGKGISISVIMVSLPFSIHLMWYDVNSAIKVQVHILWFDITLSYIFYNMKCTTIKFKTTDTI